MKVFYDFLIELCQTFDIELTEGLLLEILDYLGNSR